MFITIENQKYSLNVPEKISVPKFYSFKQYLNNLKQGVISGGIMFSSSGLIVASAMPTEELKIGFALTSAVLMLAGTAVMNAKEKIENEILPCELEHKIYIQNFVKRRFDQLNKIEQKKSKAKNIEELEHSQLWLLQDTLKCLINFADEQNERLIELAENKSSFEEEFEYIHGLYREDTINVLYSNARYFLDENKMYIQKIMVDNLELFACCENLLPQLKSNIDSYMHYLKNETYFYKKHPNGLLVDAGEGRKSVEWQKSMYKQQYEDDLKEREIFEDLPKCEQDEISSEKIDEISRLTEKVFNL